MLGTGQGLKREEGGYELVLVQLAAVLVLLEEVVQMAIDGGLL